MSVSAEHNAVEALESGDPLTAYDLVEEQLRREPRNVRLRQLRGLALSRSGAVERAAAEFRALADEGNADEETLGNLAAAYKALWLSDPDAPAGRTFRNLAFQTYRTAYEKTGGYWTGVNAAFLALAEGNPAVASELASATLAMCEQRLAVRTPLNDAEAYWLKATCGEAALVLQRVNDAADWYRQSGELAGKRYSNVASTRRQAKLLCSLIDADWRELADCFALPRVVAFTGHMLDAPDRATDRFPAHLEPLVRREIDARLAEWGRIVGFSSAACGGDLLFLEAALARDCETVVVLPFPREQFAATSVDFAGSDVRARYERALDAAGEPIVASAAGAVAGPAEFEYANRIICGLAKIQAEQFGEPPVLLAVWDRQAAGEPGGAAAMVRRWRKLGGHVESIDVGRLAGRRLAASAGNSSPAPPKKAPRVAKETQRLIAMLFADVQGFSKLADAQVFRFVEDFLARIGELGRRLSIKPLGMNTWGDGIFATFRRVREAGTFALELAELVERTDWEQFDLPAGLGIRIALHAGPAFSLRDPLTGRKGFWGAHVSRAARMEPIAPPGQVYASQAFAALASDDGDCEFSCQYVGRTPLAKGFGTFPTYHVASRPVDKRRQT